MTTMGEALAFTLFIGAAHADATPPQRVLLRQRVIPLMGRYKADGDERPVRAAVRDVMGTTWAPSGDWAVFLEGMEGP
jgi:hypothetical protein